MELIDIWLPVRNLEGTTSCFGDSYFFVKYMRRSVMVQALRNTSLADMHEREAAREGKTYACFSSLKLLLLSWGPYTEVPHNIRYQALRPSVHSKQPSNSR